MSKQNQRGMKPNPIKYYNFLITKMIKIIIPKVNEKGEPVIDKEKLKGELE